MAAILVVDDHAPTRARICALIAAEVPDVEFGEADTAESAVALAGTRRWQLAIVDLHLPDRSGVWVVHRLDGVPAIVVSALDRDALELAALQASAIAFVDKHDLAELLVPRIRAVLEEI